MNTSRVVFSTLTCLIVSIMFPVLGQAHANGNSLEIFRTREGLYEILVGVQPETPVVGTVHLTITALDAANSVPVTDAEINITAYDPHDKPVYRVRALNSHLAPNYYDANITFEAPGDWKLFVEIESVVFGSVMVVVPIHIGNQILGPSFAGTVTFAIVIFVLLSGSLYLWNKQRQHNRRL